MPELDLPHLDARKFDHLISHCEVLILQSQSCGYFPRRAMGRSAEWALGNCQNIGAAPVARSSPTGSASVDVLIQGTRLTNKHPRGIVARGTGGTGPIVVKVRDNRCVDQRWERHLGKARRHRRGSHVVEQQCRIRHSCGPCLTRPAWLSNRGGERCGPRSLQRQPNSLLRK